MALLGAAIAQANEGGHGNNNGRGHTPVTLCHWVPAHGGSFIVITVDDDGSSGNKNLQGHAGHPNDIIPMPAGGCPGAAVEPTATLTTAAATETPETPEAHTATPTRTRTATSVTGTATATATGAAAATGTPTATTTPGGAAAAEEVSPAAGVGAVAALPSAGSGGDNAGSGYLFALAVMMFAGASLTAVIGYRQHR